MIGPILAEFEHEAAVTRRLLERVPEDRLDFKPHPKSSSLGTLVRHIANIPGYMEPVGLQDELNVKGGGPPPEEITSRDQLLARYDASVEKFLEVGRGLSDESLKQPWRLMNGDKVFFEVPRIAAVRSFILSHWIHHRGQLSVYLRLLDVPLPSIYGPSADENVFAS
jgi:uncharacterized damage-inducible protein DinB